MEDDFNFDSFQKDIENNFYQDDFSHLNNADIYSKDANGNTSGYREYNDGDRLFDTNDSLDTDSFDFY